VRLPALTGGQPLREATIVAKPYSRGPRVVQWNAAR
jgi:hypothetical protein